MREFRIGTWLAAMGALAALGCDGGRPPDDPDGGPIRVDSGGGGTDSGPPRDSGTPPTPDSGGGRTCRPPLSECDILAQDCGAGMACSYLIPAAGEDPRGLCEAAGTVTEGMACVRSDTMPDTCAEGLICDDGICRQWCCDGNNADCPLGQFCLGGPGSVSICREGSACNVLDGSGCTNPDQACYLAGPDRDCFGRGDIAEGAACEFINDCAPGHSCLAISATDPSLCRKLCDPAMAGADCPTTGTYMCVGITGVTGVGGCFPMTAAP